MIDDWEQKKRRSTGSEANRKIDSQIEDRLIRIQLVDDGEEEEGMVAVAEEDGTDDFPDFSERSSIRWHESLCLVKRNLTVKLCFNVFFYQKKRNTN